MIDRACFRSAVFAVSAVPLLSYAPPAGAQLVEISQVPQCSGYCFDERNDKSGSRWVSGPIRGANKKYNADGTLIATISGVLQCTVGVSNDVTTIVLAIGTEQSPPTGSTMTGPGVFRLNARNGDKDGSEAWTVPFTLTSVIDITKKVKTSVRANYYVNLGSYTACFVAGGSMVLQFVPDA